MTTVITPFDQWQGERPALVAGMSNDDYHGSASMSASGLKLIQRSPAHWRYAGPRQPSRAMQIGTAIHTALLEPERFAAEYVCSGTADRRASEYKAAVKAVGTDELVLTQPEMDKVRTMQQTALTHPAASRYLSHPDRLCELSVFATDPATGVQIKCRPDLYAGGVMIDVKKTQDARPEAFARAVVNYGYDMAAAHYIDTWKAATGSPPDKYLLLAIEEESPHGIGLYELPADWIEYGRQQRNEALELYARCVEDDHWPVYGDHEMLLMPPMWLEARMNDEAEQGVE